MILGFLLLCLTVECNSTYALATRRKPILGSSAKKFLFSMVANSSALFAAMFCVFTPALHIVCMGDLYSRFTSQLATLYAIAVNLPQPK